MGLFTPAQLATVKKKSQLYCFVDCLSVIKGSRKCLKCRFQSSEIEGIPLFIYTFIYIYLYLSVASLCKKKRCKLKSVMSIALTLWIVKIFEVIFFQYLQTVIWFSKEGTHLIDRWVKSQQAFHGFSFILAINIKMSTSIHVRTTLICQWHEELLCQTG